MSLNFRITSVGKSHYLQMYTNKTCVPVSMNVNKPSEVVDFRKVITHSGPQILGANFLLQICTKL